MILLSHGLATLFPLLPRLSKPLLRPQLPYPLLITLFCFHTPNLTATPSQGLIWRSPRSSFPIALLATSAQLIRFSDSILEGVADVYSVVTDGGLEGAVVRAWEVSGYFLVTHRFLDIRIESVCWRPQIWLWKREEWLNVYGK
jgi:hypothetical protein